MQSSVGCVLSREAGKVCPQPTHAVAGPTRQRSGSCAACSAGLAGRAAAGAGTCQWTTVGGFRLKTGLIRRVKSCFTVKDSFPWGGSVLGGGYQSCEQQETAEEIA